MLIEKKTGRAQKIGCGVVGIGYWGPNVVRNLASAPAFSLLALCDLQEDLLARMAPQYQQARCTQRFADLLADRSIDAICIATPVSSHFPLAMAALRAGKHVFIEKPLSATSEEASQLVEEAQRQDRVLMVDHVFVFTPAVRKIRALVDEGAIGQPYYYDSVRVNLGLFQRDVNVIWDLAVHDLAIMDYVLEERPTMVSAIAAAHVPGRQENVAYVSCFFESGLIAHVNVNWLAPVKVRQTLLGGSRKMIIYDDLEPDEKIKVYDRGVHDKEGANPMLQFGYRLGDMWAPMLDRTEALANALGHFAECVSTGARPVTDGRCGLRVVQLLEAASRSASMQGRPVPLEGHEEIVKI
jgi:predicted dehydrogenase